MDKKFTFGQLAKALGIQQSNININVDRGKLIAEGKGRERKIDVDHPLNKLWIEEQKAKGKTFDINRIFHTKPKPPKQVKEKPIKEKKETKRPKNDSSDSDDAGCPPE